MCVNRIWYITRSCLMLAVLAYYHTDCSVLLTPPRQRTISEFQFVFIRGTVRHKTKSSVYIQFSHKWRNEEHNHYYKTSVQNPWTKQDMGENRKNINFIHEKARPGASGVDNSYSARSPREKRSLTHMRWLPTHHVYPFDKTLLLMSRKTSPNTSAQLSLKTMFDLLGR